MREQVEAMRQEVTVMKRERRLAQWCVVGAATLRFSMAERQIASLPPYESPFLLANGLKRIEDGFDYVLCDLSPALGGVFVNAVIACPTIIAPAEANHLAIQGVPDLQEEIARIGASGVGGGERTLRFLAIEVLRPPDGTARGPEGHRADVRRAAPADPESRSRRAGQGEGDPDLRPARFRDSVAQSAFVALLDEFLELAEAGRGLRGLGRGGGITRRRYKGREALRRATPGRLDDLRCPACGVRLWTAAPSPLRASPRSASLLIALGVRIRVAAPVPSPPIDTMTYVHPTTATCGLRWKL
jgi:hypothetical protein